MGKFETYIGILKVIKTEIGIQIRSFNRSTKREVGILIPRSHLWSFLNRRYFEGSNESIEILVKSKRIVINITTNFNRKMTSTITISQSTWEQIESEIKEII